MKRFKRLVAMCLATAMAMSIMCVGVSANDDATNFEEVSIEYIDNLLREANTPEDKIQSMDEELKRYIYENSLSRDDVEYIDVTQEQNAANMARAGYAIPTNELRLSVSAYKVSGKQQVDIYPSYEWLVPVEPKGKDFFGYSTHGSYSAVAGERSNLIYAKMDSDDPWQSSGSATYTGTCTTGYSHSGTSLGTPDFPIYIKGNFYYRVDIDTASPVKKIVLAYVHDTSWGGLSYSVGFGPFSIGITPSSNNVGYQNNIYNLNY